MRRLAAATLLAGAVMCAPNTAACAQAQAAFPFVVMPRPVPAARSHVAAYTCALAGAALVAASFPLSDRADRRFGQYLAEADPSHIESRWHASVFADRIASGALLSGEALLVGGVYLHFIHRPRQSRVAVLVTPALCALSLRF